MTTPDFYQAGPELHDPYETDPVLRGYLKSALPPATFAEIEPGLKRLGRRVVDEIAPLGLQAEAEPPRLVPYDPWGRRIDDIHVSGAWKKLDAISAEERLVATGYERRQGEWSRVHQFARVYLFGPTSAIYTCPLAMTDGAARAIELYGDDELKGGAYRYLTSSDPTSFWTSGQWMTERTGGSDVGGTSTIARPDGQGGYRLYGTKWFTSATTSQMAMTLARIEGHPEGSRGLSLFYLELRDEEGRLNGIRVNRLKDKLGTKALPTAELALDGAPARLVGGEGQGVKKISSLFNITRIWNSACAIGYMRHGIALAADYSRKRRAFGKLLIDQPLHVETLAEMETELRGCFHLVFRVAELLGREETGKGSEAESALLRLLTPIVKLYTAKQAVRLASETLESFGGAGYIEDTGLPKLLRDTQVLAIWEGTTNVLSLDMLRAIEKDRALAPFFADVERLLGGSPLGAPVREAATRLQKRFGELGASSDPGEVEAVARGLAFSMAQVYAGALLVAHAGDDRAGEIAARRWVTRRLVPELGASAKHRDESRLLASTTLTRPS